MSKRVEIVRVSVDMGAVFMDCVLISLLPSFRSLRVSGPVGFLGRSLGRGQRSKERRPRCQQRQADLRLFYFHVVWWFSLRSKSIQSMSRRSLAIGCEGVEHFKWVSNGLCRDFCWDDHNYELWVADGKRSVQWLVPALSVAQGRPLPRLMSSSGTTNSRTESCMFHNMNTRTIRSKIKVHMMGFSRPPPEVSLNTAGDGSDPGGRFRQRERHAVEVGHTEAHQHEGCEEEKHDVDERNNFDAGIVTLLIRRATVELDWHQRGVGAKDSRS